MLPEGEKWADPKSACPRARFTILLYASYNNKSEAKAAQE